MERSLLFQKAEQEYAGHETPAYFLVLVAVISTVRSLIHMFAAAAEQVRLQGFQSMWRAAGRLSRRSHNVAQVSF